MKKPLLSIAPMVDRSDRHFRYFTRLLSPNSLIYTEMHTTGAVIFGNKEHILGFTPAEKPLALQVAGDDPDQLTQALSLASAYDYDEINLNCGCPSDKVQEAHYGACLMAEPELVGQLVKAMKAATPKPVTVKQRIGIVGHETYEDMKKFVETVVAAGADRVTVHARIAILEGLDPKQNREIPPLRYEDVYRLKREFPQLFIEINGGIRTVEAAQRHLEIVDGVMIGRAAYEDPYFLVRLERALFGDPLAHLTRRWVLEQMIPYIDAWEDRGLAPHKIYRHLIELFAGLPGARKWRQLLSPPYKKFARGSDIIRAAFELLDPYVLDTLTSEPPPKPPYNPEAV